MLRVTQGWIVAVRPKTSAADLPEASALIQSLSRESLASAYAMRVLTIRGDSDTRPSSSPITRSPGETRQPPITTGKLTAPRSAPVGPRGVIQREKTEKSSQPRRVPVSRTAPSQTRPAMPLLRR